MEYINKTADTHTFVNVGLGIAGGVIAGFGLAAAAATAPVWGTVGLIFGLGTLAYNIANTATDGSIDKAIDNGTNHFGKTFFYGN